MVVPVLTGRGVARRIDDVHRHRRQRVEVRRQKVVPVLDLRLRRHPANLVLVHSRRNPDAEDRYPRRASGPGVRDRVFLLDGRVAVRHDDCDVLHAVPMMIQ